VITVRESVRSVFELLIATYDNWRSDRAIRLGAALAYYAVFSAVPLLTSAIAIAGLVFSAAEIQSFVIESLEALVSDVSPEVRNLVDSLAAVVDRPSTTSGMATLSVFLGIFAASLLFVAMQDSFNMIWKIPVQRGFQHSLQRKLVAFGVVLLTGAVLMASLVVQTIVLLVDEILGGNIEAFDAFDDLIVGLTTWGLGVAALGVLFQLLIREHLTWRYVFIAAIVTGALMVAGTWAAGVYFSNWGSTSLTGVFSGVLIVLTWLYFLAQILIAGAELLKTLEDRLRAAAAG
jgi:membrane protein